MTATKSKTEPISPAVAAEQAEWLARQAAEYFERSTLNVGTPRARETSRNRFLRDASLALPALGLDRFLAIFTSYCRASEAEAIVRQLWAELEGIPQVGNAEPYRGNGARLARKLIEAALSLIADEEPNATGGIETRGGK